MTGEVQREGVFDLMIRLEESVGAFYKACARKFPKSSAFWMSLVTAEEQHARLLRDIAAGPAEAAAFAERRRFAAAPLKILLDFVKKNHGLVDKTAATELQALAIARNIEDSVLEKKVLQPVPGDPPGIVETIRRLNSETTNHRVLIESALAALKT